MSKASKKQSKTTYRCQHCRKVFQSYGVFSAHALRCNVKTKLDTENTPTGQLAHKLWTISFKHTNRKKFDYAIFCDHRDYNFFTNLAAFCIRIGVLNPEEYMAWCIAEHAKLKEWATERLYERFVKYYVLHEDPVAAVIRSINFIDRIKKESKMTSFFTSVSPGTFLNMIEMGRVSPWLLLLYKHARKTNARMNEGQNTRFKEIVDPSVWSVLMKRHYETCKKIQVTLNNEIL